MNSILAIPKLISYRHDAGGRIFQIGEGRPFIRFQVPAINHDFVTNKSDMNKIRMESAIK